MSLLYAEWDNDSSTILRGPTKLSSTMNMLTPEQLKVYNWFPIASTHTIESYTADYHDIVSISATLVDGVINIAYVSQWKPLNELQEIFNSEINSLRDETIMLGFIYGGVKFDSDESARNNITGAITTINSGLLLEAANPGLQILPPLMEWTVYDNTAVAITPIELIQLGLSMSSWFTGVFAAGRAHKDTVNAFVDPADIVAYNFKDTLWPGNDIGGNIASVV